MLSRKSGSEPSSYRIRSCSESISGTAAQNPKAGQRVLWIDVAKGFGITAVVLGHYLVEGGPVWRYIYWFHMPFFFVLSGYLCRPPDSLDGFWEWTKRRARHLLVPYLLVTVLLTAARYLAEVVFHRGEVDMAWMAHDALLVLAGGKLMIGLYAVFWFVTCLFATQIVFAAIYLRFRNRNAVLLLVAAAYLAAHVESLLAAAGTELPVPWSLDVAMIALAYFASGYYGHRLLSGEVRHSALVLSIAVLMSGAFLVSDATGHMRYDLDLKGVYYRNVVLELVIPLVFSFGLCGISRVVARTAAGRLVSLVGAESHAIMYSHRAIQYLYQGLFGYSVVPQVVPYIVVALAVPVLAARTALRKLSAARRLVLGSARLSI